MNNQAPGIRIPVTFKGRGAGTGNAVSGEESFGELLGRVREVCLGAYSHQELPFEKLVEEVKALNRRPSKSVVDFL